MIKKTPPRPNAAVLSPGEACYVLGLSWNTLRPLLISGEIRHKRIGTRYIIPQQAIDDYLQSDVDRARAFAKTIIRGVK
ncbi:MAG: excisionase family DNA-binding protein [Nitrospirae bacterium]|uniref:excisionase family DNA-binding protein n=1 Tax=Candidatus Magnetobacterium casense TaxID=1455061 RepID=UPI00058C12C6|nr:excisionase family DNA-binding protein [Candidatus Magnetobacterium casensis]MBF0336924.1 excisionase family DNA-binding protein [Nitrospirota bacterium]